MHRRKNLPSHRPQPLCFPWQPTAGTTTTAATAPITPIVDAEDLQHFRHLLPTMVPRDDTSGQPVVVAALVPATPTTPTTSKEQRQIV
jgi:hypothetical protein